MFESEKAEVAMRKNIAERGDNSVEKSVQAVRAVIEGSPVRLKEELKKSGNFWIDAYLSCVSAIQGRFQLLQMNRGYKKENFELAEKNLKGLVATLEKVQSDYGKNVPESEKETLLSHLDIFRENSF